MLIKPQTSLIINALFHCIDDLYQIQNLFLLFVILLIYCHLYSDFNFNFQLYFILICI
jgi:hypothetical protein